MFSWTTLFNDVAQEHALIKTKRAKGTHVPSMTNELSDLMRDRDYQHRKARGLKSGYNCNMFCKLRNAVPGNIKTSKSTYYVNLISESKGNSSKLRKAVNEVLPDRLSNPITTINHNGMSFTSSSGIASALNDFFANIGTKLCNKLCSITYDFTQYLQRPSSTFNLIEISQEFVRGQLGRLKLNKATG